MENEISNLSIEEKKFKFEFKHPEKKLLESAYSIIDRIPLDQTQLFNVKLDKNTLNKDFVDKQLRTWISNQIADYLGEPDAEMIEFVCETLVSNSNPQQMLKFMSEILDNEKANSFVTNLWRLAIYCAQYNRKHSFVE